MLATPYLPWKLKHEGLSADPAHNVLQVDIHKVVERVDVLLYKTFHSQKSWQKLPFILFDEVKVSFSCPSIHRQRWRLGILGCKRTSIVFTGSPRLLPAMSPPILSSSEGSSTQSAISKSCCRSLPLPLPGLAGGFPGLEGSGLISISPFCQMTLPIVKSFCVVCVVCTKTGKKTGIVCFECSFSITRPFSVSST